MWVICWQWVNHLNALTLGATVKISSVCMSNATVSNIMFGMLIHGVLSSHTSFIGFAFYL